MNERRSETMSAKQMTNDELKMKLKMALANVIDLGLNVYDLVAYVEMLNAAETGRDIDEGVSDDEALGLTMRDLIEDAMQSEFDDGPRFIELIYERAEEFAERFGIADRKATDSALDEFLGD